MSQANPAGAAEMMIDPFTTSLSGVWSADQGTWSISSSKVNVDTLTSGAALLLASPQLDQVNYSVEVTFPGSSSTNKAGLIFTHDGDDSFCAVVLDP